MLELHRPMPHAIHQDSFLPWPSSKQPTNILPPLRVSPSNFSSATASKPVFYSTADALPTPPDMDSLSIRSALPPHGHRGMSGGEAHYNSHIHGSHPRRPLYSPSASSSSYRSGTYGSLSYPPAPPSTTSLNGFHAAPTQSERRDSPVESSVAPELRVPSNVDVPQRSMPELAAEVCARFAARSNAS
jgi:hypothetical protein